MQVADGIIFFGNVGHAKLTNNQTYKTVIYITCFVSTTH